MQQAVQLTAPALQRDTSKDNLETVTLVSAEGHEFIVEKRAAMVSNTIKNMLNTPGEFVEKSGGKIDLKDISTPILEKVIQYFYYKMKYTKSQVPIPEFKVEPDIALELMMAANFLDC
mmetsp:Transcript_17009/g.28079  ORF Transcript_17009/g.28079 Transcript_17009/m.28079 type:complete len:118 (+) Transcript_17009:131-484(+)